MGLLNLLEMLMQGSYDELSNTGFLNEPRVPLHIYADANLIEALDRSLLLTGFDASDLSGNKHRGLRLKPNEDYV